MEADLQVSVTEPTKCGDALNSYISYKILTKTKRAGFEFGETSVIRRYTDFVWLCEDFARLYPGVIIPTLPEKQAVGRFSPEFVEARRRALEKFLERIAEHPELGYSSSFIKFVQASDAALNEAKQITTAAKVKVTERAKSWLQSTTNSLAAVASKTKVPELEKTVSDLKIDEITTYINALEKQFESVHKHAENMVKRSSEGASSLLEFSHSLSLLGQTEGESVGSALAEMGTSLEKFSFEVTNYAEEELKYLDEPLEEYVRYCSSVKATIHRRQDKKAQLKAAQLDLDLKDTAYHKVMGIPGKEKDALVKQEAVEKAQMLLQTIRGDYESISEQLISEFANFKKQKANDIRNIILKFASVEAEYHIKANQFWSSLLPRLQGIDGEPRAERGSAMAKAAGGHNSFLDASRESVFLNPKTSGGNSYDTNATSTKTSAPEYDEV